MECCMCKGTLEESLSTYMVDLSGCIIIVKNVPSKVCDQCGETTYSLAVAKKLDALVWKLQELVTDITVLDYEKLVS